MDELPSKSNAGAGLGSSTKKAAAGAAEVVSDEEEIEE